MFVVCLRQAAAVCLLLPFALAARAQDTRTVTEPVIPPSCTVLSAQLAIVAGEPSSETAFDTTRIQSALTACPAGQAVELAPSGTNYAFLTQPLNIPSGVTLLVDGGVTLFGSRNPADYQVGTPSGSIDTCGTPGPNGNGCKNLLNVNNGSTSSGSGIMGYGVVDGRGEDTLLVNGIPTTGTWWSIADNRASNTSQNNPIMLQTSKANNFTLYKITVKNSPMFHLKWSGGNGFTAWGVKVITPFTGPNTDGIDPQGTNITINNSSISDGDDDVAISANSASSNISITNTTTYSGHGFSIGSFTQGGLNNLLVDHDNMAGTATDTNAIGLRIKTSQDRGGLIQNVTYSNMCLQNMKTMIVLTPFYNTNAGTSYPQYKNIVYRNLNFLTEGIINMQGYDVNHVDTVTFDNVSFPTLKASDFTPTPQYLSLTFGPGLVAPALLQSQPATGVGVTVTGTPASTGTSTYSCPASVFPYITGDLYLGGAANNKQTTSINLGGSVTLNAMVQPAMSQVNYTGSGSAAALTKPINFLEGATVVGTGTLAANGTLASATITPTTSGVHTYTAQYPTDTNYAATTPFSFGSVTVIVTGTTVSTTAVSATPSTSTYGANTTLTATVTGTAGTAPTGTVQFYDNAFPLGSAVAVATLSAPAGTSSAALATSLAGGSHSITAVYFGDLVYNTSTSSAPAAVTVNTTSSVTTLAASPTSAAYGATITLTATVTHTAGTAKPNSTVNFLDGATVLGSSAVNTSGVATFPVSLPSVATHSFTAAYAGDTNYATSTSSAQSVAISLGTSFTAVTVSPALPTPGASATFTATVTNTAGVVATGTVTFKDAGATIGTGTLNGSGIATYTAPSLTAGAHTITASYGGDGNFLTSTSTTLNVNSAVGATSTALAVTPASSTFGAVVTMTATVTNTLGFASTGTVTFLDGATFIGTGTLNASGVATATISTLSIGSHNITASYAGDTNFSGSVSTVKTEAVSIPFTVAVNPTASAAIGGAAVTTTVTVTPAAIGYSGLVTFGCSSPVIYVVCTVTPGSVTMAGTTAMTSTASIFVSSTVSQVRPVHSYTVYAVLLPFAGLFLLPFTRRRVTRGFGLCLMLCVLAAATLGMSGCSPTGGTAAVHGGKPSTGTQILTITATGATYSTSANLTLTITN